MRLGLNNFSANEVINKLSQKDLELIFKYFGEDKDSKIISKKLFDQRLKIKFKYRKTCNIINSVKKKVAKFTMQQKFFKL